MSEGVTIERDDQSVVTLTLDAPHCRNALVPAVRDGLIEALVALESDPHCRAIVIAATGTAFCSGGDLSDPGPFTPLEVRARLDRPHEMIRRMVRHSKPIIAAVDGAAYGAGFSLALACDFVVASDKARFCAAFAKIGVMPDLGLLWMLQQRVGTGKLREIVMFDEPIGGAAACAMAIADWHSAERPALDLALEKARALAASATAAIGVTKSIIARMPLDLDDVLAAELNGQAVLGASEDHQEAVRAFREKRTPIFSGR